jgi:hypothetical protein
VYSRLYELPTASREMALSGTAGAAAAGGDGAGSVGSADKEATGGGAGSHQLRDAAGYPVDEDGQPAPGHPLYFTVVAHVPGRTDFILRRVMAAATV